MIISNSQRRKLEMSYLVNGRAKMPSLPDSKAFSVLQQCWKNAFSSQDTGSFVKKRLNCREKNNACIISMYVRWVSQPLAMAFLCTLLKMKDKGYLLTTAPPDLERGVAPLSPPAPAQWTLKRKQLCRGDKRGGFSEAYCRIPGHRIPSRWVTGTFTFGGKPQCYWNHFSSNGNDVCYSFPSFPPCLIHSRLNPLHEFAVQGL